MCIRDSSCAKEHKNLDDCITFILNYVQQSGCNGFTDAEIYSLAVHYYDAVSYTHLDVYKRQTCDRICLKLNFTIPLFMSFVWPLAMAYITS